MSRTRRSSAKLIMFCAVCEIACASQSRRNGPFFSTDRNDSRRGRTIRTGARSGSSGGFSWGIASAGSAMRGDPHPQPLALARATGAVPMNAFPLAQAGARGSGGEGRFAPLLGHLLFVAPATLDERLQALLQRSSREEHLMVAAVAAEADIGA